MDNLLLSEGLSVEVIPLPLDIIPLLGVGLHL
jgi:hypothetical protein